MMTKFGRQLSLRTKLMMLAMVSGTVALLFACASFMTNDVVQLRDAKANQLRVEAELLGFSSSPAMVIGDHEGAAEILKSLRLHSTIRAAAIYDRDGHLLAQTYWPEETPCDERVPSLSAMTSDSKYMEYLHTVGDDGDLVGMVYVRATLQDLHEQLANYRSITARVMGYSLLAAILMAFFLQRGITRPIVKLAETADQITKQGDYSIRVEIPPDRDEIGRLCQAFNQMLDRIEVSDRVIKNAHDELEQRVADRTSQLLIEINQREQVQADLVRAKESAESANRAKSEFLANMSHEIRTPLNAILGFAELLRRDIKLPLVERYEYLDTIHRSGQHLLTLINDILDLSKIEAGQMETERIPFSPYQIVAEAVSVLRVRAKEKGLSLDYAWNGPVPERITNDPSRLRQLILNLVGNAIKFTDCGGVQVLCKVNSTATESKFVVEIVDTGVGIPEDKLQSIFNPFSQADTSVTRRFGGTGLGLAICRRLAKAMGGGVHVTSQEGEGSTFTLEIATGSLDGVRMQQGPISDIVESQSHRPASPVVSLKGKRILVVDDGVTNRRLIEVVLRRVGAEIVQAENGQQALEVMREQGFDLVLMDMQMPVMDGYAACSRARELGMSTPILALTAHAMIGDEQRCLDAGCSGYLTKPINVDKLVNEVGRWLGGVVQEENPKFETPPTSPLQSTLPMDDPDFRDIVREFIERCQEKHAAMQTAFELESWQELRSLAHWLKGAGGTAGFPSLTKIAGSLEVALKDQDKVVIASNMKEIDFLVDRISLSMELAT